MPDSRGFKLSVVVTRQNAGQLDELKALADDAGAQLRLARLRPSGRGADVWNELHPTADQQRAVYEWLLRHGDDVLTGDSFFHLGAYGEALPGLNLCGAGRVVCLVDPIGDVYACPFAIHDEFLAGNVRSPGGFVGVWRESALFTRLRQPQSAGACASCGQFDACRGGCMAAKFFTGLPLAGPDPECVFGHGAAALATADRQAAPRPGRDHSRPVRPQPPADSTAERAAVRFLPRRAARLCEEHPLAGVVRRATLCLNRAPPHRTTRPRRTAARPSRVVFGPHVTNLGRNRSLSERHVAYYRARAEGGAGVVVTETASVDPSDWPYERAPLATDCLPGWRQVADACRPFGTTVLASLGHRGAQGSSAYSQAALVGPSPVADVINREMPMVMEESDIAALVEGFRAAAQAAVDSGLDGVEIDAGVTSILRQFHSGLTNQRTDGYGTDRLRLTRQVIEPPPLGHRWRTGARPAAELRRAGPVGRSDPRAGGRARRRPGRRGRPPRRGPRRPLLALGLPPGRPHTGQLQS